MALNIIAAVSKNNVIGIGDKLPWKNPEEMMLFKQRTSGNPVIMGRKTWESLGGPLKNRDNIIITAQKNYQAPEGVKVFNSIKQVDEYITRNYGPKQKVYVIGGAEIYKLFINFAEYINISYLDIEVEETEETVFFPEFNKDDYRVVTDIEYNFPDKPEHNFTYKLYKRK